MDLRQQISRFLCAIMSDPTCSYELKYEAARLIAEMERSQYTPGVSVAMTMPEWERMSRVRTKTSA